jgi:hypothetical protein
MRAQRLQLVVLIGAVDLERVDAARAFGRIEPAARQQTSGAWQHFLTPAMEYKP